MARGRKPNTGAVQTFRVDQHDSEATFARTINTSAKTGRQLREQTSPMKGRTPWTKGRQWEPEDNKSFSLDSDGGQYDWELSREPYDAQEDMGGMGQDDMGTAPKKKKKRSKRSRRPGIWWMEKYRDTYLDEMLRNDGRGDFTLANCVDCLSRAAKDPPPGIYRCKECFLGDLTCQECCVRRHRQNPLHRIQRWPRTSNSFQDATLQQLGLVLRLNHHFSPCPRPHKSHQRFQILDINGIHNVTVEFCDCERKIEPYVQLLRRRIYPSSQSVIETCATFCLLEHLHLLSLVGKAGTKSFYKFLEKSTNNTGFEVPKSRYRALQRMLVQWRHLKMLKRAGRGHVENGIATTQEGQLAVPCPHCPRPKVNLREGWENAPLGKRFLYQLIVCVDFNFRLKGQLVSSWTRDPGLGDGWSYFVPRKPYEDYIKKHLDEEDVSTCVGFAALAQKNTRATKGLRYTGVGAAVCGQSEMVLPNGVANLEKGERYSNSDFMLGYALKTYMPFLLTLVIAYDIACQWIANLAFHIKNSWDDDLKIPRAVTTIPVIPKFHHPAHREEEHDQFNCNYVKGLGASDCECCERLWAVMNAAAPSTKPMGPGSRLVVLNDHFGFYNWSKYVGIGATLARRYVQAVKERNQQQEAHRGLTDSLPDDLRKSWEARCRDWEESAWDGKPETPFQARQEHLSVKAVEEELKAYESEHLSKSAFAYHTTSASAFLVLGLELEQGQRTIRALTKANAKTAPTSTAGKAITEQRTVLRSKIRNWAQIRAIYMPGLLGVIGALGEDLGDGTNENITAENIQFWMPSAIPANKRDAACIDGLVDMEKKLREARCHDDLDGIRHTLRLKSRMLIFKNQNISGQKEGVKSRTIINNVHERAKAFAESYRENRKALVLLVTEDRMDPGLKVLRDSDVRSYSDPERAKSGPGRRGTREDEVDDEEPEEPADNGDNIDLVGEDRRGKDKRAYELRQQHGTGETRMVNSWIWLTGRIDRGDGVDEDDALLLEVWAKSRARVERAGEEVDLLREEMHRTLSFLVWKGKWWREQAEGRTEVAKGLGEGLRAYAYKQEQIQMRLERQFKELWSKPLKRMEEEAVALEAAAEEEIRMEGNDDGDEEGDEDEDDDGGDDDYGEEGDGAMGEDEDYESEVE
ncbi:hypothetical protein V5O48_015475 [Marasmius crinis-equi]|uniref:CxC2-like cysteine cluster KDZ transposase-associated domain-containing protein n=1 Tax=Marasmius crinis-equi TaxID=585013 RepID=A0ABR3EUG7_9AGAR